MREIEGETNERVPVIKMKQKVNKLDWIKPTKIIRATHLYDLNSFLLPNSNILLQLSN